MQYAARHGAGSDHDYVGQDTDKFDFGCDDDARHIATGLLGHGSGPDFDRLVGYLRMWWSDKRFKFSLTLQEHLTAGATPHTEDLAGRSPPS